MMEIDSKPTPKTLKVNSTTTTSKANTSNTINTNITTHKTPEQLLQIQQDEEYFVKVCSDLPLIQDKIKRDKELYKEDFLKLLELFKPKFSTFLETPNSTSHTFIKELIVFYAHISNVFYKELEFIPQNLKQLLDTNHSIIHPEIRLAIIESFSLLRKKNLINPTIVLPMLFQLLTIQDKQLRSRIQEIIITDLGRINEKTKNNQVNKYIRNTCSEILSNINTNTIKQARKTLNIMINLYKKKIWNDTPTINAIANACSSMDRKISHASCKFFLSEYEEIKEDSDNEDFGDLKHKYKLLGKGNNKKTKKRKDKLKKLMKAVERRDARQEKVKTNLNKDFMPIDLLNDPSSIADKLFDKLRNLKNRKNYQLKIDMMRFIGRLAGRHKLIVNNFFVYLSTQMKPRTDDLNNIMASIIEATHNLVPPVELEPITNELFDKFICESYPAQFITVGLNALRELANKNPYIISKSHYTVVEDIRKVKNKSVRIAAKAFVNLIRDVNPNLVFETSFNNETAEFYFGKNQASEGIEGIELLKAHEGIDQDYKMEANQLLTDDQLKKLRVLRLKQNAEAVQSIKLNLNIDKMLGDEATSKSKKRKQYEENLKTKNEEELDEEDEDEDKEYVEEGEEEGEEEEEEEEDGEEEEEEEEEEVDDIDREGEELKLKEKSEEEGDDEKEGDDNSVLDISENSEILSYHSENSMNSEQKLLSKKRQAKQDLEEILEDALNSSQMDEESEDHGFMNENEIDTYKKTYREKRDDLKNVEKEEFKMNRKSKKKGGKTNFENRKNKPMSMIIHKVKNKQLKNNDKSLTHKIKNIKRQLGRFKRGGMVLNKKGVKETKKAKAAKKKK